jgi:hypothetical protein
MDKLRDPKTLRLGSISKKVNGQRYVVRTNSAGTHYWAPASKQDIACSRFLTKKIKKLIKEVGKKKGPHPIQSREQALAVAYNMAATKFPTCGLVNRTAKASSSTRKTKSTKTKKSGSRSKTKKSSTTKQSGSLLDKIKKSIAGLVN